MKSLPCHYKETTFYLEVEKNITALDSRDNRGKRHDLGIILLGVSLVLLSNRDGNLSSIHRHMRHHYEKTCSFIGRKSYQVVSRSQLPLVLSCVHVLVYEQLIFDFYGITLTSSERRWFSGDGKELRGSIEKGNKRGECVVQLVSHASGSVQGEIFYNGKKESEKPAIRDLIEKSSIGNQKISLDALHFCPDTLALIAKQKGGYLVGLKENQKELFTDMTRLSHCLSPHYKYTTVEKGHGRVDTRIYQVFDVESQYFDPRWDKSQLRTLVQVERNRLELKTGKETVNTSLYMSNLAAKKDADAHDLFQAVRRHWAVEVTNHMRDVILKEDKFRTKKTAAPKLWLQIGH